MKHYINTVQTLLKIVDNKKTPKVIQLFVSCILYYLVDLLPPTITAGIISVLNQAKDFNKIWLFILIYIGIVLLYLIIKRWNLIIYSDLSFYYSDGIQQQLLEHVAEHNSIFDKISRGKIIDTYSEDIPNLIHILQSASLATAGLIQLGVVFFVFGFYNFFIAIIALCIQILYFYFMVNNSKHVSRHYEGVRKYKDKIVDIFNQLIINLKQVRSLNLIPNLNNKLNRYRESWRIQSTHRYKYITNRYCQIPAVVYFGKAILYIILAFLVFNHQITIDKFILLIGYFEITIKSAEDILEELLKLGDFNVRVNRVKSILDYTVDNNIDYGSIENDYIEGLVVFNHVNCTLQNRQVLTDITFKALPNEITTIVGYSGAGKTAVIDLLYRLRHIKSGSILIDDESIYNYSNKIYSSNVSGVFQKAFTFKMSIRDNLSLIDSDLNHQIAACKRVGIHKAIEKLPNKYNTIIDEDQRILTEGQIQKLAIARAILSKAEILLFDEVTSNVDTEATSDIIKIINDLKDDHTIIITTHKPEIMKISDQIIVMKNGRVVAKGKNSEVYKKSALYRELYNATYIATNSSDSEN